MLTFWDSSCSVFLLLSSFSISASQYYCLCHFESSTSLTSTPTLSYFDLFLHYNTFNLYQVWAVKWYRGNFEIFRFIADEDPPTKIFKLDNFNIDVSLVLVSFMFECTIKLLSSSSTFSPLGQQLYQIFSLNHI